MLIQSSSVAMEHNDYRYVLIFYDFETLNFNI